MDILAQGKIEEQKAFEALSDKYIVDDRRDWWKQHDKPYAMDFYLPHTKLAIDFKFKGIKKEYNTFALNFEHFTKYMHYFNTQEGIDKAILWYKDCHTGNEYSLDLKDLEAAIYNQTIKLRYSSQHKKQWESGCFFGIPLSLFDNFSIDF